jgi:hypothetical protein
MTTLFANSVKCIRSYMSNELTPEMIHVLDHLVAETNRFGDDPKPVRGPTGPAHKALLASGVQIGSMPLLELCALHAEHHRSKGITEPAFFNPPAWNPSLADEGVIQIVRFVNSVRNQ